MDKICLHCYISGRVQGVFYRKSAQKKAAELTLTGWVHNLSDGRVELMICGEKENVEKMREWLWDGPTAAEVSEVAATEVDWEPYSDFHLR